MTPYHHNNPYNCSNTFGGGHALVLRGFNDDSTQDVYYIDPYAGSGYRSSYTYFNTTLGWGSSVFWK
ncbi:papain-like cysteine protease family protein [Desulfotomaculum sp. 1211_IL3151]|uniref:papain-like cysteine protease family protein n=1 Tax=Desulfotomaculum sp. 1211_IL3151 TaxID=3084055 RepID=UPI003FA5A4FB